MSQGKPMGFPLQDHFTSMDSSTIIGRIENSLMILKLVKLF